MSGKRHTMDFIQDRDVYRAVMFSRKLIGDGLAPPLAHARAARYYGVPISEVAKYVGQHAARIKAMRRHGSATKRRV